MINNPAYQPFRTYLEDIGNLSDMEWDSLEQLLSIKQVSKKQFLHTSGKKCKVVGFIIFGCFRSVKNYHGEERTFDFAIENEFITDYHSIITRKESEVDIVAVEDSQVICVDADSLLRIFDTSFTWQKIRRHLAEYVACYYQQRLFSSYYDSPKTRYNKLQEISPELFFRIPHHILANYLGLTKETLSRLRHTDPE